MAQRELLVYRNEEFLGRLLASDDDDYCFVYDSLYLSQARMPLSLAMPLQESPIKGQIVFNYFDGLLPEGREREALSQYLRVSYLDTSALLAALCGECIGDITLLAPDADEKNTARFASSYQHLSRKELDAMLTPQSPRLYESDISNRISLAGAQTKIGLYYKGPNDDTPSTVGWSLPRGLAASTHIIKTQSNDYKNLAENEALCMRLAANCGIDTASVALLRFVDTVLAVRRFDRRRNDKAVVQRLHQEDICQIVGISPLFKYQVNGGPNFAKLTQVIEDYSTNVIKDTEQLARLTIFNYLIGNCDAHAKNFSLLDTGCGNLRLAPAYDLICTTYYNNISRDMAMQLGQSYAIDDMRIEDFRGLARTLRVDYSLIHEVIEQLSASIQQQLPKITQDFVAAGFTTTEPIARHIEHEVAQRLRMAQTK